MRQPFATPQWAHSTNVYEVNLRQYTPEGSFAAFATHLPRLADMGVQVLWFMPITPIATEGRLGTLGSYYACADYTSCNPEYGTVLDFKTLVQQAHGLGFKVIIDWVANHTGMGHTWTRTHPDFYLRDGAGNFVEKNGWTDVIDLDFSNRNLERAMIEAMQFWVDACDIDGFRCDMAHLVPLSFWRQARTWLDTKKPLFWLAECEVAEYHQVFDATYTWHWMQESARFVRENGQIAQLDRVLYHYNDHFSHAALRLYFTTNHDENSWNGTEYEKYGAAAGCFAVFSHTWNGIPLIYSGQEMPNTKRLAFFDKDPIAWNGEFALHNFYKTLLSLRQRNPALRAADAHCLTARLQTDNPMVFAFKRSNGKHAVVVVLNLSPAVAWFEMRDGRAHGHYTEVFEQKPYHFTHGVWFEMPAWSYWVMEAE
jgi:alpha-amylase